MWAGAALLLLAVSSNLAPLLAQECSGHGTLTDGRCECNPSVPTAEASGWVGSQCEQEVKWLPSDGSPAAVSLEGGSSTCYFATLKGASNPLHYFAASVTLDPSSSGGIGLYGKLAAEPGAPVGPGSPLYPRQPVGEGPWDTLTQVTPGSNPHAVLQLRDAMAAAVQAQGIYLCAHNPGGAPTASFSLRAAGHSCPLTLHDNGFISICSSTPEDVHFSSDVCPAGTCACTGVYAKPDAPVDPGLGFETCSAAVESLPDATGPEPVSAIVAAHPPHTWHYFNFTLADTHKHVALVAAASQNTSSRIIVHLRPIQPPGYTHGTYVARSSWGDFSGDLAVSLQVGPGMPDEVQLTPGVWYAGVYAMGDEPAAYTLSLRRSACAGISVDCAGRGTCDPQTATCTCSQADFTGADCSSTQGSLQLGQPVSVTPRAFHADAYSLSGLADKLATPTVALTVKAQYTTKDALPGWVTARPQVLLAAGKAPTTPLTPDTATFQLSLDQPQTDYTLTLDAAQVVDGELQVVVWNPLSTPYQVGYTLAVELQGRCLDACSGHGQCGQDGRCTCEAGWLGASCSVDGSGLQPNSTDVCQPGSRLPQRREEQRATCWAPCDPTTGKYQTDTCIDFTCDPTSADGRPQRRAGAQQACVVDLCSPAAGPNVTVTDPSGTFVCDAACTCPADGGVCAPDATCLPGSEKCLNGLVLQTAPDGTPQCVQPPPTGVCEEGSLKPALAVEGGTAYGVCVCSAPQQCGFTSPTAEDMQQHGGSLDPSKGVVTCSQGYQVVGAQEGGLPLSDGRKLTSGGRCVRVQAGRRGVSGGMVFFWCLFSVALAATLVVGGRRAAEWYEERRWSLGSDSDVHEGLLGQVRLGLGSLFTRGGGGGGAGSARDNHW